MNKKMIIILIELILWIPIIIAIFHFPTIVTLFNKILLLFGVNTQDTHLSLGSYILLAYFIIGPIMQIMIFKYAITNLNIKKPTRLIFTTVVILSSILAAGLYINGKILLS
ncbi:MAG: hypothetical protein ACJAS9_003730 [Polaribacter sp.]|jgi:hypothetical protein